MPDDDAKIASALSQLALMEMFSKVCHEERAKIARHISLAADRDAAIEAARPKLAANMARLLEARAVRRKIVDELKAADLQAWLRRADKAAVAPSPSRTVAARQPPRVA